MKLVRNASVYSYGVAVKEEICKAMFLMDQEHKLMTDGIHAHYTSIVDGLHSRNSLHYVGLACDLRIWYLPKLAPFIDSITLLLGEDYDIVLEKDHIHVEFQPTR